MRVVCPHCLKVNNIPKKESYKKANCGECKNSLLENKVIELNSNNFDEVLVNSDIPVIVDFWAPWCGPCISFAPIFKSVASQFPLKALFVKVNTEEEQQLGARFQIESIPTLMVFKDGNQINKISGAMDKINFTNFVKSYI
jgi:thioredoxin 2